MQNTYYVIRISDCSSDVCSSYLRQFELVDRVQAQPRVEQRRFGIDRTGFDLLQVQAFDQQLGQFAFGDGLRGHRASVRLDRAQAGIPAASGAHGEASGRERVFQSVWISGWAAL